MDCVFCAIRDGQIPSFKVFEDSRVLAFMDINPVNDGHLLVIPKAHSPNLFEVADDDLAATLLLAKRLAIAVKRALQPDGLNLLQANGAAASQTVFHFHVHVIPRWTKDGKGIHWSVQPGDQERVALVAERIKDAI